MYGPPEIDEEQYVEFFETLKVKYIIPIEEIGETTNKKISIDVLTIFFLY